MNANGQGRAVRYGRRALTPTKAGRVVIVALPVELSLALIEAEYLSAEVVVTDAGILLTPSLDPPDRGRSAVTLPAWGEHDA